LVFYQRFFNFCVMKNIKENWLTFVITSVISIAIPLSILSFSAKKEDTKAIYSEIKTKAPYTYVDTQDANLRREIQSNESQHLLLIDMIREMRAENQANFVEIRKQLYKK
jgi:hypothetical protein